MTQDEIQDITYPHDFVNELQGLPILFVETEVCIFLSSKRRDFLAVVSQPHKLIDSLLSIT